MKGSGGTAGGVPTFMIGLGLFILATYLFFDSVIATSSGGLFTGWLGGHRGGLWETTSMGLLFVPFFLGVMFLFVDAKQKWAWWLVYGGLAILAIEILSRIRFVLQMKTTHLLGLMVLFAAGAGLMIRSYRGAGETD